MKKRNGEGLLVAMTGTSGNMGREALAQTLESGAVRAVRVLLTRKPRNDKLAARLQREYKDRIEIVRGGTDEAVACAALVKGTDLVVHMAAVIPPKSDADPAASYRANVTGTQTLAAAVAAMPEQAAFVHVSTMALYDNRDRKHPWGRVGDPLLPSAFDAYAMHKLRGEYGVVEAGLQRWAVLRQTAMLHPNMLKDNMGDGLMFHTPFNTPLEWVSARDSGYLIRRIAEREAAGELEGFWKHIYNIGGGARGRVTGFDTFEDGFSVIGGGCKKFFRPDWCATRNFHGLWFYDADALQTLFGYQRDGVKEYWQAIADAHKFYRAAKILPAKLISALAIKPLLRHKNSPRRWLKDGDVRALACFGSEEEARSLPEKWKDFPLLAESEDYDRLRDVTRAKEDGLLLCHGYDDTKPVSAWTKDDYRSAAAFRGGAFLDGGGPYEKALWADHTGLNFEMTPYAVLKGGYWSPARTFPAPWDFDRLAKHIPYYAQVWYDSHGREENACYDLDEDGRGTVRYFRSDDEEARPDGADMNAQGGTGAPEEGEMPAKSNVTAPEEGGEEAAV